MDPDSPKLTQAIQKVWQNISSSKYKLPQSGGHENAMLQFKPGGGKIQFNEDESPVATDMNAFVHRDWLLHCQYLVYWGTNEHVSTPPFPGFPDCADRGKRMDWINATYAILNPAGNNEAYQNYIDRDLPNWLDAYYGSNLSRLKAAKDTYDPDNFWKFAQSIPPPDTEAADLTLLYERLRAAWCCHGHIGSCIRRCQLEGWQDHLDCRDEQHDGQQDANAITRSCLAPNQDPTRPPMTAATMYQGSSDGNAGDL